MTDNVVRHFFFRGLVVELVNFVAAGLGIIGALVGGAGWFAGAVKKSYAAEREFLHIRADIAQGYKGIENELELLSARVERMELSLIRIEAKLYPNSDRNQI